MAMSANKQKRWYTGFFISHVMGYAIAWAQTIWIVYEVRKIRK
jgi:heme/copper-type cytochrome/quinol oxidase subunit 4